MESENISQFNQDREKFKEKPLTIEEKQIFIDKNLDVIKKLTSPDFHTKDLQTKPSGSLNGITFETVFKTGVDQPVSIIKLSFPENISLEIVLRPTKGYYEDIYQQSDAVKKYYPHIYYNSEQPKDFLGHNCTLVLERIEGYEQKLNGEEFEKHIANPENFEKLCKEIFQMVNDLYKEPLILNDIYPTNGHNIIFNKNTDKFQLFDVDTIKPSDWSFEKKFMDFIKGITKQPMMEDKEIHFLLRMIQQYLEEYNVSQLSHESNEYTKVEYLKTDKITESLDNYILPDNPDYKNCYRTIDWRGVEGKKDLPPLFVQKKTGKDHYQINCDLIEAIAQNNFEKAKQVISRLRGRIIEDKFVETKK